MVFADVVYQQTTDGSSFDDLSSGSGIGIGVTLNTVLTLSSPVVLDSDAFLSYQLECVGTGGSNLISLFYISTSTNSSLTSARVALWTSETTRQTGYQSFATSTLRSPVDGLPISSINLPAGTYYFNVYPDAGGNCNTTRRIKADAFGTDFFGWITTDAVPPYIPDSVSIVDVVPQYDDSVASTTVGFQVTLFNDSAENVKITLQNMDDGQGSFSGNLSSYYIPTAGYGLQTVYGTTTLRQGYQYGNATLVGGDTQYSDVPFPVGFTVLSSSYDNINFPDIQGAISSTTPTCQDCIQCNTNTNTRT